jgi:hypothetical protein
MLTADHLREIIHYDPETGVFTWRIRPSQRTFAGDVTGVAVRKDGYCSVKIGRQSYKAHRLAWLYMTGEWPEHEVDHRDRNRANNVWRNLRAATKKQNQENRTPRRDSSSGVTGVLWSNRDQAWRATIVIEGRKRHIGTRKVLSEAVALRAAASRQHHTHSEHNEGVA